jgi:hypothetical protein
MLASIRKAARNAATLALTWWECSKGHWNADCEATCVTCGESK